MLSRESGNFKIAFAASGEPARSVYKDGIQIGRLDTCDVILDHKTVSRIHAAINFRDGKYVLVNLSSSNILTLNGRALGPQKDDVLASGDTIQIGPFTILASIAETSLLLDISQQVIADVEAKAAAPVKPPAGMPDAGDVLKVFWEKRTREKEDLGTRLRPTEKPKPGKAMFNWRPTRDLKRTWRLGLFVWAFLIIGVVGVFAYFRYPQAYSPKPLSNPHAQNIEGSTIAVASNSNSCTTCHTANEPLENSCVKCHQAEQFHATNTKAHEDAGITCTACHKEHLGADFDMNATAIQSCAECHNDANKLTYNGKAVRTAHEGSYGYPAVDGKWTWKGVYREVADAIPEINSSATGDKDEQAKLSRHFHTVHTARLKTPEGLKGDSRGLVSCSTCHNNFEPIDRVTPRQTCAACHTTKAGDTTRDQRFGATSANCISCHTQHPYGGGRWSEFLTEDALKRRQDAIAAKIASMKAK
jgi:pSer/pThr/pTyr-binding forkhead associated (FHA) protein